MKPSVWAIFMVVSAIAIIGFVVAGQIAQSKSEAREPAVPPVNPQPYYGREPDGRMFYRGTDGVKTYPDGTSASATLLPEDPWRGVVTWRNAAGERIPPPVSASLQKILNAGTADAPAFEIRESFNTTGRIESVVEDGADRYLLARDADGTLRVVLARKGQPNRTLAVIRQTWRAEVPQ